MIGMFVFANSLAILWGLSRINGHVMGMFVLGFSGIFSNRMMVMQGLGGLQSK